MTSNQWNRNLCRIESGIYWPDDSFCPIDFSMEGDGSVSVGKQSDVSLLNRNDSENWCQLNEAISIRLNDSECVGGSTPCEGSGWFAYKTDNQLQWIVMIENGETISKLSESNGILTAVANEYPFSITYTLSIQNPKELQVKVERDN